MKTTQTANGRGDSAARGYEVETCINIPKRGGINRATYQSHIVSTREEAIALARKLALTDKIGECRIMPFEWVDDPHTASGFRKEYDFEAAEFFGPERP